MTASQSLRPGTSIADPDAPSHVLKPNADGSINITGSLVLDPTNLATGAKQDTGNASLASIDNIVANGDYETVAASQTAQVLGGSGATGDYLAGLLVTPASLSPGVVTILDNATSINLFAGGTDSVTTLIPFFVPIGAKSVSGAWKCTTGASVSVLAIGSFT
jgi:hypothetical protein